MSRRSRTRQREVSTPSLTTLLSVPAPRLTSTPLLSPLSDRLAEPLLGDRRAYHPLQDYAPATFHTGATPRIGLKDKSYGRKAPSPGFSQTKAIQAFGDPQSVDVCIRRHRRREILFAKKVAGRGGGRRKRPPRKNWYSAIKC